MSPPAVINALDQTSVHSPHRLKKLTDLKLNFSTFRKKIVQKMFKNGFSLILCGSYGMLISLILKLQIKRSFQIDFGPKASLTFSQFDLLYVCLYLNWFLTDFVQFMTYSLDSLDLF